MGLGLGLSYVGGGVFEYMWLLPSPNCYRMLEGALSRGLTFILHFEFMCTRRLGFRICGFQNFTSDCTRYCEYSNTRVVDVQQKCINNNELEIQYSANQVSEKSK